MNQIPKPLTKVCENQLNTETLKRLSYWLETGNEAEGVCMNINEA